MKKIFILFIISFVFLFSCEQDLMNTVPDDRISTDIFWQSEQDAIFATIALYPTLPGNKLFEYDGITDIFHTNALYDETAVIEAGNADATFNRFLTEWSDAYTAIWRANNFFENIELLQTNNTQVIDQLKGEVRTIRAYHYIQLVMLFGDVPLITTNIDIDMSKTITRTPVSDIWDYISVELTLAALDLPLSYADMNIGRVTKGAALGLKARAMLFAGRFQESADAAKQIIDLDLYSLYPSYENLFQYDGENCNEVILDHQFAKDVYPNNYYGPIGPWSLIPGYHGSENVPTKKLIDMYDMENGLPINHTNSGFDPMNPYENRDPRLKQSVFVTGSTLPNGKIFNSIPDDPNATDAIGGTMYTTTTGWNVKKYISPQDVNTWTNSGINMILLRYAEVLLTYAEAKIEMNQVDNSVFEAINQIRGRQSIGMPPIAQDLNQEEMRALIRKERTIELAFEGFRLFDIRRWRIAENVMPGKVYGMTYYNNEELFTAEVTGYVRVFNANRDYLWPIPQREIELNPNLIQNPNY